MIKDDYLMRMIRRAAEAIARAVSKQHEVDDAETRAEIESALGEVVKLPVATLVMLDADSLLPMLGGGDAEAARVVARGLAGLAELDARAGDANAAKQKRASAISIYTRVGIGDDAVDRETVRALTAESMG